MLKPENQTLRCGAALVEMALILPLLVLLLLICVDFGRFATVHVAVTNAAREGASFGGTHSFTNATYELWKSKMSEAITAEMRGIPAFSKDELTIDERMVLASDQRARVQVKVSYVFRPAVAWPAIPRELKIVRTAEMPVIR